MVGPIYKLCISQLNYIEKPCRSNNLQVNWAIVNQLFYL